MLNKVDEILKVIGWTDGYHVPVLNEENEKISKKVEGMLKDKAACILKSEDLTNRVNAIEKHVKDIKEYRQHVQALIYSFRKCADSEDHMIKVAARDAERMQQDMHKFSRLHEEASRRNSGLACEVRQLQQSIEALKRDAQFDKETLDLWEEEILRKEKENQVIDCYFHEDDLKVKGIQGQSGVLNSGPYRASVTRVDARELTHQEYFSPLRVSRHGKHMEQNRQLERLQLEVVGKQGRMDRLDCDVQSLELALENMCGLFRRTHSNRQYLIQQWESCVGYMAKRDEEISIARHEMTELRVAVLQQRECLQEEERFLQGLQRDNRETEWKTQALNRHGAILMRRRDHGARLVDELKSNISNARREMASAEKRASEQRCTLRHLTKECAELEARAERARDSLAALEQRLARVKCHQMTARERASHLEDILQAEEQRQGAIASELRAVQANVFRGEGRLQELREEETVHVVALRGAEASLKTLAAKKHAVVREYMNKSQLEYHLDFLIQKLETRISRMTGRDANDRHAELSARVESAEAEVARRGAERRFLATQKAKLDDEERRLRASLEVQGREAERLSSAKAEEVVAAKQQAKWLSERRAANERLLLDEGVLRMRVDAALGALASHGRQLLSLEKEALELDTAMKERRLELGVEREVLEVRKRATAEEASLLGHEVRHMHAKVGRLQKRYEIETASLACEEEGGSAHEDDEPMSLIRFNLKVAQRKQELQEEGDLLQRRVQGAEAEICALEATLRLVSGANDALKSSGGAGNCEDPHEAAERANFELRLQEALQLRRRKNLTLVEHQNEVAERTAALAELDSQIGEMSRALKEEAILASGLSAEMQEQALKQGRAVMQAKRLQADVRKAAGDGSSEPTFDERDQRVRALSAATRSALHLLAQLCALDPEAVAPRVECLLGDKGLLGAWAHCKEKGVGAAPAPPSPKALLLPPAPRRPANTPASSAPSSSRSALQHCESPALCTIDGSLFAKAQGTDGGEQQRHPHQQGAPGGCRVQRRGAALRRDARK